jgi:hypothetical protein
LDPTYELTPTERVYDMFVKHEQARVDLANVTEFLRHPQFADAACHLSDVPVCLALVAELNLFTKGPDFTLR